MRGFATLAALAALAAPPAFAQMMSGPREMSPIDGTSLPGNDASNVEKAIQAADQRDSSSRATPQQQAERAAYVENLRIRRAQAEQYVTAIRNGAQVPPGAAGALRHELETDIEQWRAEFRVGRVEREAMLAKWLVPLESLTALEWAERRVDWWAARDAWVAGRHQ
jgi:hypothetical protein